MENTQIIISINLHENVNFFLKQLENIETYVDNDYIIIINTDRPMYSNLMCNKIIKNHPKIIINPEIIKKKRFHGSLSKGIYSNMKLALSKYNFDYFVVLSSRTFFYNNISVDMLNKLDKIIDKHGVLYDDIPKKNDNWTRFMNPLFTEYLKQHNHKFIQYPHEGFVCDKNMCAYMVTFLDNNQNIKNNLFNFNNCVEEFFFQSFALIHGGFISLHSRIDISKKKILFDGVFPENKYTYKLKRE